MANLGRHVVGVFNQPEELEQNFSLGKQGSILAGAYEDSIYGNVKGADDGHSPQKPPSKNMVRVTRNLSCNKVGILPALESENNKL